MERVGFHDIEQSLGKIIGVAQKATPASAFNTHDTALGVRFAWVCALTALTSRLERAARL